MTHPILTPSNHELMKAVRASVHAGAPMASIAEALGLNVDELCHWILDVYQAPPKPSTRKIEPEPELDTRHWSLSQQAQRFANWRRAKAAATAALGENKAELSPR